jgi:hypothetical protein
MPKGSLSCPGMSGSPIVTEDGAIGVLTISDGAPNPLVGAALPGRMLEPVE